MTSSTTPETTEAVQQKPAEAEQPAIDESVAESVDQSSETQNAAPNEPPARPQPDEAHERQSGSSESPADTASAATSDSAEATAGSTETGGSKASAGSEAAEDAGAESAPQSPPVVKLSEQEKLQKAAAATSYKDLPTLLSLQKRLERLQASESETGTPSLPQADEDLARVATQLQTLIAEHQDWQQKLIREVEQSVITMTAHISEGRVSEAQSLWDRSQNTIKRLASEEQERLQAQLAPLKPELNKLLDWKKFASSEKKKELIDKMEALTTDESSPPQKAKLIRALQDEWKLLGHSDANDDLWTRFSELAKVAFEPCKVYFKERKEKQAANLIARNNICEQLEAYAATMDENDVNLAEVSKLENQAREDWKKYAPVAQAKIKNLQKRFNTVLSDLRQKKRQALQAHNAQKQALIDQAQALLAQDDLQAAIQQAKTLQQDWKALGAGSFKDDRKLWTDFRAACDALFERRDAVSKEQKQQQRQVSSAARDILSKIAALLSLTDEEFSQSRSQFNTLAREFRAALTPDMKAERKALQDQFNQLSRKYEARLRTTPDKKVLQLMQQVQAKAELCQVHEETLLTGSVPDISSATLEQTWSELDTIANAEIEQAMKKRFRQLLQNLQKPADWPAMAAKQETRARELCVAAEIMSGADTPAADKAIRMQQQLNQLQRGLGRMPLTQKDKVQQMQETEMEFLCLGPLLPLARSTLQNRLQHIRQKI
ncbi:DUF349 domain-containing protein [Pseudohongiella sp.]|uniref:DUF349 domain-containing protein n=1 Tax=marine sediment metagenome TaxID=412755 RepID=A0A0F9W332_9ZZZZ|nr:DUF349 domain-containing protein [Pseudohongiella sp.]HDZ08432.1 DUF349 domain-containing protein [Pseudohongiella sp.]HEA62797.1 DUF349 domain-containing protein [Pseudohongiella sp.]